MGRGASGWLLGVCAVSLDSVKRRIHLSMAEIEALCRKYHMPKLALFGSVPRKDFYEDSGVDILIEFEPGEV